MKFTVTPIIRRFGFRTVLVGNGTISAVIMMGYALFRPSTPYSLIIATLLIGGFFRSLQFTCLNTLTYADVPATMMSGASTLASMTQQLFISLGVSVGALMLHLSLHMRSAALLSADDFVPAFLLTGLLSLLSALLFIPMASHAGAELSGHANAPMTPNIETTGEPD